MRVYKYTKDNKIILLIVHVVDDTIITGNDNNLIAFTIDAIKTLFRKITIQDNLSNFVVLI